MHCPGILNPANLPSQRLSTSQLANSRMWWEGPAFIELPAYKWPKHEAVVSTEHVDRKIVKNPSIVLYVFVGVALGGVSINLEKIIDPKRFSSIIQLL